MHYYIVFLCNWPGSSNAIVKSIELTTAEPSYVTTDNDYVYVDLTAHLNSGEIKTYGTSVQEVMNYLVQRVGGVFINKTAKTISRISMSDVKIEDGTPASRKIEPGNWNGVVKPAMQRLLHTSSFGTL